jgi:hypothetical protein
MNQPTILQFNCLCAKHETHEVPGLRGGEDDHRDGVIPRRFNETHNRGCGCFHLETRADQRRHKEKVMTLAVRRPKGDLHVRVPRSRKSGET